jgi:hypothetical protein
MKDHLFSSERKLVGTTSPDHLATVFGSGCAGQTPTAATPSEDAVGGQEQRPRDWSMKDHPFSSDVAGGKF